MSAEAATLKPRRFDAILQGGMMSQTEPHRLTPTERLHEVTMASLNRRASEPTCEVAISRNAKGWNIGGGGCSVSTANPAARTWCANMRSVSATNSGARSLRLS